VSANNEMPRSALLLGWGGVLPFVGLALAAAIGLPSPIPQAETMLIGYGAVILSFMGGVHWGGRCSRSPGVVMTGPHGIMRLA
jgi:hypothetical protein